MDGALRQEDVEPDYLFRLPKNASQGKSTLKTHHFQLSCVKLGLGDVNHRRLVRNPRQ